MAAGLRPGGVLLDEEGDYGLVTYSGHPDAARCTELFRRQMEALKAAGVMDGFLARTLPGLLIDSGLELVGGEVETRIARPGDASFEFHRLSVEAGVRSLIGSGLTSDVEAARVLAMLGDPSVVLTSVSVVAAWGRVPT